MNIIDIIIGVLLIIFALAGCKKGLVIEAFYLASFIIGIYFALYFSDMLSAVLSKIFDCKPEYMALIAFILLFVMVTALIRYIGRLIKDVVDAISLGLFDKIGGFVFGLLKGVLLITILIMLLNNTGLSNKVNREELQKSILYANIEYISNFLYDNHELINESINNSLNKGAEAIENMME